MSLVILPGVGLTIRPATSNEIYFEIETIEDHEIVVSEQSGTEIVDDKNLQILTSATTRNLFHVGISPETGPIGMLNNIQLSVIGAGLLSGSDVTYESTGDCIIIAKAPWLTKSKTVTFSESGGSDTRTLINYLDGSLAKECSDEIDNRLTPGKSVLVYATQNHTTLSYTRNVSFWGANLDFTCVSPWNSDGEHYKAGVAVSPRHIIFAAHWQIAQGATVRFVTNDDQVVTRTISAIEVLAGGSATDTAVALLGSDLPNTISFVSVPSGNLANYMPDVSYGVPCCGFDQYEQCNVYEWFVYSIERIGKRQAILEIRTPFTCENIAGVSGNPIFLIINGKPVLLSLHNTTNGGPAFFDLIDEINTAMTTLGGGYQLTEVDLSGFTDYS